MKKIWIAIFLLITAIGLCTYEQIFIEDFCDKVVYMCEQGDADGIRKLWNEKNDIIYIFSEHDMVDDLAASIEKSDGKMGKEKEAALAEIRVLTYVYHENQRITLSNIF